MLPVGHLWVFWGDHIINFEVAFLGRSLLPWQSYANKCDGNSKVMVMLTEVLSVWWGARYVITSVPQNKTFTGPFPTVGSGSQASVLTADTCRPWAPRASSSLSGKVDPLTFS